MGQRILLVEGKDDEIVVAQLLKHHDVRKAFDIKAAGGDKAIVDNLPTYLKASELERISVIIDADTNIVARWAGLRDRARQAGYTSVPDSPRAEGTIIEEEGLPLLGFWVMPNNTDEGILEDFLAHLIAPDDPVLPHVDVFIDRVATKVGSFPPERHAKARIHAWLAVQDEPGKPLGQAITARYLRADGPSAAPFLDWLRRALVD